MKWSPKEKPKQTDTYKPVSYAFDFSDLTPDRFTPLAEKMKDKDVVVFSQTIGPKGPTNSEYGSLVMNTMRPNEYQTRSYDGAEGWAHVYYHTSGLVAKRIAKELKEKKEVYAPIAAPMR